MIAREDGAEAVLLDDAERLGLELRGQIDDLSSSNPCRSKGGGLVGKGWVGEVPLAGNVAGRHGALLDGPYRLAGDAVEDVDPALLGRLRDRLYLAAVDGDVGQDRAHGTS